MEKVFNTVEELVKYKFFIEIMGLKKEPSKKLYLKNIQDFSMHKSFKDEYADMIIDKTFLILGISIKKLKNKNIDEIIKYLVFHKRKNAIAKIYR